MIRELLSLVAVTSLVFTNPSADKASNEVEAVVRISYQEIPLIPRVSTIETIDAPMTLPYTGYTVFDARSFKGKDFGNKLNSQVTGIKGVAAEYVPINYTQNLQRLWDLKIEWNKISPATQNEYQKIVDRYRHGDRTYTTLRLYEEHVDRLVRQAHFEIDFKGYCSQYGINDDACATLIDISGRITGRDMMVQALVEIMPSHDGMLNARLFDSILRHGGIEYVEAIPALGDKRFSLGPWQLTSDAVYRVKKTEGASSVSRHVSSKDYKIGDSISILEGDDHPLAAYYFAIYNLGRLVAKADAKQLATLRKLYQRDMGIIREFVSPAHHTPTPTINAMLEFLDADGKKSLEHYLKKNKRWPNLPVYAAKASINEAGLRSYLK